MKSILTILMVLLTNIMVYSQNDTLVKVDNKQIVGKIIEITSHSAIIEISNNNQKEKIEIGHHLIAYIKYSDQKTHKFRYNKWRRKTNNEFLFKNGFYFNLETGYCLYQRTGWNTDDLTNQLIFHDERENLPRIGIDIGNRWLIYKTDSYGFSAGIKWLNLSFSPSEYTLLETVLYTDWMFTASVINPEITNTFLLKKNSAIEQSVSVGYMYHLGESTHGFSCNLSLKYRYKKFGIGASYTYGKAKDVSYARPITLNTVNLCLGLKF